MLTALKWVHIHFQKTHQACSALGMHLVEKTLDDLQLHLVFMYFFMNVHQLDSLYVILPFVYCNND